MDGKIFHLKKEKGEGEMKLKKWLPVMLLMVVCLFTLTSCEETALTIVGYTVGGLLGVLSFVFRLVLTIVGSIIALIAGLIVGFLG